jgi:diguanylate cyclase (GGDEF)-like protein/PAS domain S-box-containing protein
MEKRSNSDVWSSQTGGLNEFLERLARGHLELEEIRRQARVQRDNFLMLQRGFREMRAILRAVGRLGVFIKNYRTGEAIPNGIWKNLGYDAEDMRNDNFLRYVHPEDAATVDQGLNALLSGTQNTYQNAYRVLSKDGELKWILSKSLVVSRDREGRAEWFVGADFDITLRVRSEERAREARSRAERKALEAQTLLAATTVIASTLDWETAVQRVLDQAALVVPNDATLVVHMLHDSMRILGGRRSDGLPVEVRELTPDRESSPFSWIADSRRPLSISDISQAYPAHASSAGIPVRGWLGVPLIVSDMLLGCLVFTRLDPGHYTKNQIRLAEAFGEHVSIVLNNAQEFREMRRKAMTDSLTNALSRRAFFDEARVRLVEYSQQGKPVSIIMIDLDHFKHVNDRDGHAAGDQVLRSAAALWAGELRDDDVLGRLGGEEFAVLLPGASIEAATRVAERLRKRTMEIPSASGHVVTASFGVTCTDMMPAETMTVELLLQQADHHLYQAKHNGRNRVVTDGSELD